MQLTDIDDYDGMPTFRQMGTASRFRLTAMVIGRFTL